jgi:hypothetical protein
MSVYRVAINQTTQTINGRATYFRNLIVAVVVVGLGSSLWALVAWVLSPLAGFFLLLPICGVFFFLDSRLLNQWRSQFLQGWARGELDCYSFRAAVGAVPTLPKDTLQSMLATLPLAGDLVSEQRITRGTREAVVALVTTIHACQSDMTALRAAGFTIAGVSLMAAVLLWMWQPLCGMVAVTALPLLHKWMRQRRLKSLMARALVACRRADFNYENCLALIARLDWNPVASSEKDAFLAAVRAVAEAGQNAIYTSTKPKHM